MAITDQCLMSVENECLTVEYGHRELKPSPTTVQAFLDEMGGLAPCLPSPSGIANGYGVVYPDPTGHLELAACECDSPYLLPTVIDQQQLLAREAVQRLFEHRGIRLLLSNLTYSGLFEPGNCPTWGAHSNYLVEEHPREFADRILPFLATRIYAGAGVVQYPGGQYLASSRAPCMECDTGGGTTEQRAIHSTARDEPHMAPGCRRWRYHLICGDGHRSHFNIALQAGATMAALKAIFFNPRLVQRLPRFCRDRTSPWTSLMRELNVLANPGEPLRVDPRVIEVQRIYLEEAYECGQRQTGLPPWWPTVLEHWAQTLRAMKDQDNDWLAARLDAWIKHALFSQILAADGHAWTDLPRLRHVFDELALLDQNYHEFTNPDSVFDLLERQNLLRHRVADPLPPGGEPEPYVPATATRARARARFIRENAGQRHLIVDWGRVVDTHEYRCRRLSEPFAQDFGPWEGEQGDLPPRRILERGFNLSQAILERVRLDYERGAYTSAHQQLRFLERHTGLLEEHTQHHVLRYRAWLQSRLGCTDGAGYLDELTRNRPVDLAAATDYVVVYRFATLGVDPRVWPWLQRGRELLAEAEAAGEEHSDAPAFCEHLGYTLLRENRVDEALQTLESMRRPARRMARDPRIQGRVIATLGDAYRLAGSTWRSQRCLRRAESMLEEHQISGEQADFAWTGLAKLAEDPPQALAYLARAKEVQRELGNQIGLARTLLLEARRCRDPSLGAPIREQVAGLQTSVPSLRGCELLQRIIRQWDQWISEPDAGSPRDTYWGL